MPIASWSLVRIYGTWVDANGTLLAGDYKVKVPTRLTNSADDVIIPAGQFGAGTLNTTPGSPSMSVMCPSTDDPDIQQDGWMLEIEIRFNLGQAGEKYVIEVPMARRPTAAGGNDLGVNLRDIALTEQLPPQAATYGVGLPGGLATLGSDAKLDAAQIPDGLGGPVSVDDLTDATTVGKAVAKAANAAAARTAIGAGTSSLALGTAAGTAAAGDDSRLSDARTPTTHTHTASQVSDSTSLGRSLLSAATAAAARDLIFCQPAVSVTAYGATGDGTTNDTTAIQAAITAANGVMPIWVPKGTYMIDASVGLQLTVAGTQLLLANGATLKAITNALTNYVIVNITAADCIVFGGTVMGDVTTHTGGTGEWGHGITINGGAHRCRIEGVTVKNCWGDGIYVGNGTPVDVKILNVVADSNRRQGLSIVGANRIQVRGGSYINTGLLGAVAPSAGIDVEPNPSSGINVLEFLIESVVAASNAGPGIQVTRATAQTTRGKVGNCITQANTQSGILSAGTAGSLAVDVVGCTSAYNAQDGFQAACPGLVVNGGRSFANTGNGVNATSQIDLQGCAVSFNAKAGILFAAGSDNSTAAGMIVRSNCSGAATTYQEIDVVSTNVIMSGSIARPATSGNRAIYGINVRTGATGAVFAGCRATAGTTGAINAQGDTVQAPAVA